MVHPAALNLFIAILLLQSVVPCSILFAETRGPQRFQSESETPTSFAFFDANRIGSWISNRGELVSHIPEGSNSGMFWPRNTTKTIDYASGLWVVGKVKEDRRASVVLYRSDFVPGKFDGAPDNQNDPRFRMYMIDRHSGPGDTDYDEWPVADGAPVDSNGNPLMIGDKTYWSVFNDMDTTVQLGNFGKTPLGIEVRQTIWGYDRISMFGDMMLFSWQIYNMSPDSIDSAYIAIFDDADLGVANNDLVGVDTLLNIGFTYNDGPDVVYGSAPPAIGYKFLSGAAVPSPSDTAYSFGKNLPGYKNLMMTAFPGVYKHFPLLERVPFILSEAWFRMQGLLGDGSQIIDPTTGQPTLFSFSGDPVTGTGWIDLRPEDRRILTVSGPFSLAPGDSVEFTGAVVIGAGNSALNSITELRKSAAALQGVFDNRFITHEVALLSPLGGEVLSETDTVRWAASSQVSDSIVVDIYIFPFKGDMIQIAGGEMNDSSFLWNTALVPDDIYTMAIEVSAANTLPAIDWSDTTFIVDNIENGAPSIIFDSNPTGNAQSEILLQWTALDPEGDSLDISLQYKLTWNNPWETVVEGVPNTGEYLWNTYDFPNNRFSFIRLIVSDGEFSDTTSTKSVSIKNKRLAVLDNVFTNVIGTGNNFAVNIIDSSALTGHDYIVTFGESRHEYTVKDSQTSEVVLPDGVLEYWLFETPLFDGIRLSIGFESVPGLKEALWKTVTSDTSTYGLNFEVLPGGAANPADYQVRFSSVENDTTRFGDLIVPFQVWNISNSPETKVILDYFGTSTVWQSGLVLSFYESNLGRYTWNLQFIWDESDLPPQDGDVLLLKTLFPHNAGDMLLFNTNGAPIIGVDDEVSTIPAVFSLAQNYPNPFNPLTNIRYSLPVRSEVRLMIYNLRGQEIARLIDGDERPAGVHTAVWDASSAASGLYFYRLTAGDYVKTRKMVLLK